MKKKDKYKKEQTEIVNKIIEILEFKNNYIVLHKLENNVDKQNKILALSPDIKKYFNCYNIGGIKQPEKIKKPWISIIRQILKTQYDFISSDYTIYNDV